MVKLITKHLLLLLALAGVTGCGGGNASETGPAAAPNSNKAEPAQAQDATNGNRNAETAPVGKRIAGLYTLGEVHKGGVVTMITPELKTVLGLTADGSYVRIATKGGQMYRRDSGSYSIEEPDKLVLMIQRSTERGVHNPPTRKPVTFTLSEDNNELRLRDEDGSIGVFRRNQEAVKK